MKNKYLNKDTGHAGLGGEIRKISSAKFIGFSKNFLLE